MNRQRRELVQWIAAITGWAFVGHDASWAAASEPSASLPFSSAEVDFFDDVADTILPRTDTPGARDAQVGAFIARYSAETYTPEHIALLKAGLLDLEARGFRQATAPAKTALLKEVDGQAKEHARQTESAPGNDSPHYFTLMKQLTLYGYFTSQPGATLAVRYRPIPGRYRGCIPYNGETFWAW